MVVETLGELTRERSDDDFFFFFFTSSSSSLGFDGGLVIMGGSSKTMSSVGLGTGIGLVGFFRGFWVDFLGESKGKWVSRALGWRGEFEGK